MERERRGQPVVQRQAEIPVSEYQQGLDSGKQVKLLPENVRFWSDFNRVFYHPRSSIQINDRDLRPSPLSLEHFSAGEELFASLDPNHEIIDEDLRPFVEEADSLQGFQIMTSMDDAWAGFAARYMEQLRDEYAKAVVISWGIQSSLAGLPLVSNSTEILIRKGTLFLTVGQEKRLRRLANRARTLVGVGRESSLFVPLRVPGHLPRYLQLTAGLPWHRSALFATAVETAVLPSRLKAISVSQPRTFNSFVDTLNLQGTHPIATLELSARPKNRPKVSNGAPQTAPRGNGPHSSDGERESHEGLDMNLTSWAEEALVRRGHSKSAPVETFGQFMVSREAGEASGPQFDGVYIEESELEGLAVLTKYVFLQNPPLRRRRRLY